MEALGGAAGLSGRQRGRGPQTPHKHRHGPPLADRERRGSLGPCFCPQGTPENPGINQRALQLLFSEVQEKASAWEYTITVSAAEIYNEALRWEGRAWPCGSKSGPRVLLQPGAGWSQAPGPPRRARSTPIRPRCSFSLRVYPFSLQATPGAEKQEWGFGGPCPQELSAPWGQDNATTGPLGSGLSAGQELERREA